MIDFFVYFSMTWLGFVTGYLLGMIAGSSQFKKKESEVHVTVKGEKDLCTDYSHLKKFSKKLYHPTIKQINADVYDTTADDDEFKVRE